MFAEHYHLDSAAHIGVARSLGAAQQLQELCKDIALSCTSDTATHQPQLILFHERSEDEETNHACSANSCVQYHPAAQQGMSSVLSGAVNDTALDGNSCSDIASIRCWCRRLAATVAVAVDDSCQIGVLPLKGQKSS